MSGIRLGFSSDAVLARNDVAKIAGGTGNGLGIALVYAPTWPTLSQMFRDFMRPLPGRVVLFGIWLWLGWHLFIRGWNFFLRG